MVNATMPNDNLHGIWVTWASVKAQLLAEARGELSKDGVWGSGEIDGVSGETFLTKLQNTLYTIGISVKDGVVSIANLAVQKSDTDIARIKKMEMVDSTTGEIYCTWIAGGEWVKIKGDCTSTDVVAAVAVQNSPSQAVTAPASQNEQNNTEIVETPSDALNEASESTQEAENQAPVAPSVETQKTPEEDDKALEKEQKAEEKSDEKTSQEPIAPQEAPAEIPAETSASTETPEPAVEPSPVSFIGSAIRSSTAGLINAIWEFTSGILSAGWRMGVQKISSIPFVKNATASILQNSEELKSSGLLSSKTEAFTASLYGSIDRLFKISAKIIGR